MPTGSEALYITIGIIAVARLAAVAPGPPRANDQVQLERNQIRGQLRELIVLFFGVAPLDDEVLASTNPRSRRSRRRSVQMTASCSGPMVLRAPMR